MCVHVCLYVCTCMYSRLWHAAELGEVSRMYNYIDICVYICVYMYVCTCVHVCTLASGTPLSWARYLVCISICVSI